jgi:hypothetical protein
MTMLRLAAIRIPVRIPVPAGAAPWIVGLFLAVILAVMIALTVRGWKSWAFAAWAVVALAWVSGAILKMAPSLNYSDLGRPIVFTVVFNVVSAAVLVWAALLVQGLRRRIDVGGALLAAVVYGLVGPPLSTVLAALMTPPPRPPVSLFLVGRVLAGAAFAAGLLVVTTVAVNHLRPLWRGLLAGLVAGTVIGTIARVAVYSAIARAAVPGPLVTLLWSVGEGLILGGLAAAAARWLRRDAQPGGVVFAPTGRAS